MEFEGFYLVEMMCSQNKQIIENAQFCNSTPHPCQKSVLNLSKISQIF